MKYPFIVFYRSEKFSKIDSFFIENNEKLNCTIFFTSNNADLNKLFDFNITENILIVTRIDKNEGWVENLSCDICISSKERIYLFRENDGLHKNYINAFVTYNNIKVFDSHDINYVICKNKK